jgi:hypothetical protein
MATGTIVGKGLYLEFVPAEPKAGNPVLQLLFTPEGFDEQGRYTQFTLHSRTISETSPRKQWRLTKCGVEIATILSGCDLIGQTQAQDLVLTMVDRFEGSVRKAVFPKGTDAEWKLRSKPIAVEITSFDLLEVNEWKTPAPALRRIQKCRVALDFPEKLV